ncbi:kelch-like protein diablo [Dendronephthya gigantea]|uniref:kelch-like protein diablo n=1 Tax=Dendronephthya gigantea TaxID=151771 RepID=UPI00106CACE7|nr:kelch-like protein diablo [Dendronephthya gigantea]
MENRFEKRVNQFINRDGPKCEPGRHKGAPDNMKAGRSDQATAVDPFIDLKEGKKYAYIVAGGQGTQRLMNSAEVFDKTSNSWQKLQPMKSRRAFASSVVHNDQILVAGGETEDNACISSIEQFSRFWSHFQVNMPKALREHRCVMFDDRMFIIGGFDPEKKQYSDLIYEVQLRFPFNTKILAKLPTSIPVRSCGVVLVGDKILMFGGYNRGGYGITNNVTMYDISQNEFKELAPLPTGMKDVATVKFVENVVLAGGFSGSDVFSYNVETQKCVNLPSMSCKRLNCCAVVDGQSMVVMGGWCGKPLDSVEAYDFRTSAWRKLPSMKEARHNFIAEII